MRINVLVAFSRPDHLDERRSFDLTLQQPTYTCRERRGDVDQLVFSEPRAPATQYLPTGSPARPPFLTDRARRSQYLRQRLHFGPNRCLVVYRLQRVKTHIYLGPHFVEQAPDDKGRAPSGHYRLSNYHTGQTLLRISRPTHRPQTLMLLSNRTRRQLDLKPAKL